MSPAPMALQVPLAGCDQDHARGLQPLVINHQGQFPRRRSASAWRRDVTIDEATAAVDRAVAELHIPDTLACRIPGRRPRLSAIDRRAAAADLGGAARGLYRARRALREPRAPADDHLDAALGRPRRAAGAAVVPHRPVADRLHRHHPADRHRQEERHHDGRLRARGRTQARARARRRRSTRPASSASGRS